METDVRRRLGPILWQMHVKVLGDSGELAELTACRSSRLWLLLGPSFRPRYVLRHPVSMLNNATRLRLVTCYRRLGFGRNGDLLQSIMAVLVVRVSIN